MFLENTALKTRRRETHFLGNNYWITESVDIILMTIEASNKLNLYIVHPTGSADYLMLDLPALLSQNLL